MKSLSERCESTYYELEEIAFELRRLLEKASMIRDGWKRRRNGWI